MYENENKQKNKIKIMPILIAIILCSVTIGYAALSTTMAITGSTTVKGNTWNFAFENYKYVSGTALSGTPVPSGDNSNKTLNYAVALAKPGDYAEFTIDLKNTGTLDAVLSENPIISSDTTYIHHQVTYADGSPIRSGVSLKSGQSITIKIKLTSRKDISNSDLKSYDISQNFSVTFKFAQK